MEYRYTLGGAIDPIEYEASLHTVSTDRDSGDRRSPATPSTLPSATSYGLMVIRLSTFVTPGADQAARSAS
jgi:hypothetical protein